MSVEENVKLGELIDIYGNLLSEKQKLAISQYIELDLSLSEIAESENITRSGAFDAIQKAKEKLYNYEEKLKVYYIKTRLREIMQDEKSIKENLAKLLEEI